MASPTTNLLRGGAFLIQSSDPNSVFTPEQWTEEQKAVAQLYDDFIETKVLPNLDAIDAMDPPNRMEQLLTEAGELGMLGVSIPETYGGFGMSFNTSMLATEILGKGHSFSVAVAAHTGIGTLPILYFGNEAQKAKYLPGLAAGTLKSSYCLTEPGSGSDALAARTKAVLNPEGTHYILNGQKMWITNAGFADVFIVFAKINGEHFTGFIVEKGTPGLTLGEEEHKMGIKGSSTRQVFFSDAPVPVENVLGEIGKGHLIAFNILNIGRIKLGAAVLGGAKQVMGQSISYALERQQFGQPIFNFGAIQHKLAEQAIRIYANESAVYRTSDAIEQTMLALKATGKSANEALLGAAQEFAAECALLKVSCSEMLDFVVDEGVQIYGGYGFSADFPMDRAYRDSRINRIFEGTNEINRMLTVEYLLKKALKGELQLLPAAKAIQHELMSIPDFGATPPSGFLAAEAEVLANLKKAVLLVAGAAVQRYQDKLAHAQEVLMHVADMVIGAYLAESMYLRVVQQHQRAGSAAAEIPSLMFQVFLQETAEQMARSAKPVIYAIATGDEQRMMLMGVKRFTKINPINEIDARRKIAQHLAQA
jgi:alkylation response protein AidB-like acyl-CoA dehydrogenase